MPCAAEARDFNEADVSGLLRMLASVPDSRGRRYLLEFSLAVCIVATLVGAENYREIGSHAADMPQGLLKKIGAKWCWFKLRHRDRREGTARGLDRRER
jgi:hypothetical protein